jgi:hypothetical protein
MPFSEEFNPAPPGEEVEAATAPPQPAPNADKGPSSVSTSKGSNKVRVSNLPYAATEEAVSSHFASLYGPIRAVRLVLVDKQGDPHFGDCAGHAYVDFVLPEAAEACLDGSGSVAARDCLPEGVAGNKKTKNLFLKVVQATGRGAAGGGGGGGGRISAADVASIKASVNMRSLPSIAAACKQLSVQPTGEVVAILKRGPHSEACGLLKGKSGSASAGRGSGKAVWAHLHPLSATTPMIMVPMSEVPPRFADYPKEYAVVVSLLSSSSLLFACCLPSTNTATLLLLLLQVRLRALRGAHHGLGGGQQVPDGHHSEAHGQRGEHGRRGMFALNCLPSNVCPQMFALNCLPSTKIRNTLDAQTAAILVDNGVSDQPFSHAVEACLPDVPSDGSTWLVDEEEVARRRDFRDECVFTIDPPTARDLDDALHIKPRTDGKAGFEVGVHIADVSFFIPPESPLDLEARERATSVYLCQRVVPMLPRLLCEQLCSLNPGVDRYAFSCVWQLSPDGSVEDTWFGRSVIRSRRKLAYGDAQVVLDAADEGAQPDAGDDIAAKVLQMWGIAKQLRQRRYASGALSIQTVKLGFVMNEEGDPIGAAPYKVSRLRHAA